MVHDYYWNSMGVYEGSVTTVLEGDGQGQFSERPYQVLKRRGVEMGEVGDLNNDGKLDLLVIATPFIAEGFDSTPELSVWTFLGDGQGAFTPTTTEPVPMVGEDESIPMSTVLEDVDGDGFLDAVFGSVELGKVRIMLNDGSGILADSDVPGPKTGSHILERQSDDRPFAFADIDLDGDSGLVVLSGGVEIYLSDEAGQFRHTSSIGVGGLSPFGDPLSSVVVGDLNNDQVPDLLVGDGYTGIAALLGEGNGNFTLTPESPYTLQDQNYDVLGGALADVNLDGNLDFVARLSQSEEYKYGVFFGDGSGKLLFNQNTIFPMLWSFYTTDAGVIYFVKLSGTATDVDLRLTNLMHHAGTTVMVHGTDEDDTFEFAPTGSYQVTINGVAYHFDAAQVGTVQFDGGDGNNTASINDSSGNDVYTATPDYAVMEASDFTVRVVSCSIVHAYARNGGVDTAIFIDSPGKDKVKAEDGTTVKMYGPNRSYLNRAKFFETVQANFSEGGTKDDARLWNSPMSDIFDGVPGNGRYYSENAAFDVSVLGADLMTVYSTNGGNNKLILHDSPGDDVLRAKPHKVELFDRDTRGKVHKITARKFKDVTSYADHGGRDIAKLYDSTLNDFWEAEYRQGETWSKMTSTSRALYEALAFEQVKGYSVNGGTNTLRKRIVPPEVDFVLTHGEWEEAS